MTKYIESVKLIQTVAHNLEQNFNIPKRQISSSLALLFKDLLHHSSITNNIPKEYKIRAKTYSCPKCGKKLVDSLQAKSVHYGNFHEPKKEF